MYNIGYGDGRRKFNHVGSGKWLLNWPSGVFVLGFGSVSKFKYDFAGLRGDGYVSINRNQRI